MHKQDQCIFPLEAVVLWQAGNATSITSNPFSWFFYPQQTAKMNNDHRTTTLDLLNSAARGRTLSELHLVHTGCRSAATVHSAAVHAHADNSIDSSNSKINFTLSIWTPQHQSFSLCTCLFVTPKTLPSYLRCTSMFVCCLSWTHSIQ